MNFNIKDSLEWLENDLFETRKFGKVIILNFNDIKNNWKDVYTPFEAKKLEKRFINIINKYEVTAIFVGNDNKLIGKSGEMGGVPLFYCGSIPAKRYLLVKFTKENMIVEPISIDFGKTIR